MQDSKEPHVATAKKRWIGQHAANRITAGLKDSRVAFALMFAQHSTHGFGNRKRHQKMVRRQHALALLREPLRRLLVLARRTMPIATRATDPVHTLTTPTCEDGASELSRSTSRDRADHLAMAEWDSRRNLLSKLREVVRCMLLQAVSNGGHYFAGSWKISSIAFLASTSAFSVRCR